jgi:hypothetical protein
MQNKPMNGNDVRIAQHEKSGGAQLTKAIRE